MVGTKPKFVWTLLLATCLCATLAGSRAFAQQGDDDDDAASETPPPAPAATLQPGAKVPIGGPAGDLLRRRIDGLHGPGMRPGPMNVTAGHQTPAPIASPAATVVPTPAPATGNNHPGVQPTPVPAASGAAGGGDASTTIGNGLIETNPKATKPLPWNQKITLGPFDDTDLEQLIKLISRATARNFIYDKKDIRAAKVTMILPSPLTVVEAYQAFQTVLAANGLTLVQVGPNLQRIMPRRDASSSPLDTGPLSDGIPYNDSFMTRIIRLQNIDVGQIQGVLQQLSSKDGAVIQAFTPTNSVIITDTANNIRRLSKIIDELDRSGGEENIEVLKVHYADVQDVAQKIQDLFGAAAGGAAGAPRPGGGVPIRRGPMAIGKPGMPFSPGATPAADGGNGEAGGETAPTVSKVIPDQRTNQVIVVANDRGIQSVEDLLAKIDVPLEEAGAEGIHVYYLQNADADELATVLSNLAQGVAGSRTGGRTGTGGPGQPIQPFPQPGAVPGTPGAATGAGGPVAVLSGDVKITSDKATNALVITASKSDYQALEAVIKKLDIRRQQVFVEAVVMEMTVNKELNLGLNFAGATTIGKGAAGFGGLNAGQALVLNPTALASGFAAGVIGPSKIPITVTDPTTGTQSQITIPPFGVSLQALETDSDVNVISRPSILAKENEESEIVVATSVSIPGNLTISQTGLQNFSITTKDVGVTLRVTPKINESDYVSLKVFNEVTDIENQTVIGEQRLIDTGKRSATTNVVVHSGQTIVIGGLLSDSEHKNESKIPLLGEIPFFGWLFKTHDNKRTKENLLIFLTPTIINDDSDLDRIYKQRFEEREEFNRLYANQLAKTQKKGVLARFFGKKSSYDDATYHAPASTLAPFQPTPTPAPEQATPTATPAAAPTPQGPKPLPDENGTPATPEPPAPTPTPGAP